MWNAAQRSQIRAVEMSYMRGACGMSRWNRESNEDTYGRFGMSEAAVGVLWVACGVSRWDRESNEDTYERFGMSEAAVGVLQGACGVSR